MFYKQQKASTTVPGLCQYSSQRKRIGCKVINTSPPAANINTIQTITDIDH